MKRKSANDIFWQHVRCMQTVTRPYWQDIAEAIASTYMRNIAEVCELESDEWDEIFEDDQLSNIEFTHNIYAKPRD